MSEPICGSGDEFITLIGADMNEIHDAFRAHGLAAQDYAIVHRAGRHNFTRVDGGRAECLFGGERMMAATFRRQPAA